MKRLFLTFISVSSLIVAQPWHEANHTTYRLPNKDKEKLDMILLAIQGLQDSQAGSEEFKSYNKMYTENSKELHAQIERAHKGVSLSGWISNLSSKERILALKKSLEYILNDHVLSTKFVSDSKHRSIINELKLLIDFAEHQSR
jgi:hypothetical protein